MNSVNITGRVGQDIELRHTPAGKAVCDVSLAVDDGFGDNKKTVWITVTIWDKAAETAHKFAKKGDVLGITGRLSQDEWEDKTTGKKVTKIKLVSESMTLLPNGERGGSVGGSRPPTRRAAEPQRAATPAQNGFNEDDDIPF